jgi:hypothetical protein
VRYVLTSFLALASGGLLGTLGCSTARIATSAQPNIGTGASRLEVIAAKAKSADKARVDVLDPLVGPLVFANPDNEFRNVGAVVISHIRMDVATVVTRDWVFSWAKVSLDRVVSRGQAKFLEPICAEIPRPAAAQPRKGELGIPLRRGSTQIDGVTLTMSGWQSKLDLKTDGRYLLFGGFCGENEFFLSGPDPLVYSVNRDGSLGAAIGDHRSIIEGKKTIDGIAAYLASLTDK